MITNKTLILSIILCSLVNYSFCSEEESNFNDFNIDYSDNNLSTKLLEKTISDSPKSKTAKLLCAKVYLKHSNYKEAYNLIREVLKEDPNNNKAKKILKELELHQKFKTNKILSEFQEKEEIKQEYISISPIPAINLEKKETNKTANNNIKKVLPSKAEILQIAKIKKQTNENNLPIKEKDVVKTAEINNDDIKDNTKENNITNNENTANNTELSSIRLESLEPLISRKKIQSTNLINYKDNIQKENIDSSEQMVFKPYISKQFTRKNSISESEYKLKSEKLNRIPNSNVNSNLSNTSKSEFLKDTTNSFYINLEEAYTNIEKNNLNKAKELLEKAYNIAVSQKNNKKLLDVQLSRAVIYIYDCDFNNYGKHILSIRKGISEDVFKSLEKIYETSINIKDNNSLYKYISNLAYDSGHYVTAIDIASKIKPQDKDSSIIIQKSKDALNQINGEILLNNGSYLRALDYFEKEKDESEIGRTYLAISKSLYEAKEPEFAKIAENYGLSTLLNYIENDPNNPKANLYLALYSLDKGEKNNAKEAIRRGLNAQGTNDLVTTKLLSLSESL